MKKSFPAIAAVLVLMMLLTSGCASADSSAPSAAPAPVQTEAPAPAASPAAVPPSAPAESSAPADPVVDSWRIPPSPYGDDFEVYLVLNADGSFLNATNLFEEGKNSGPYTQTVVTNETFRWKRIDKNTLELHYDYGDDNGEFVSTLTYDPVTDALYMFGQLYANRDSSFVLDEQYR